MAEGTYEYECMRSELLGIAIPNKEEFEKARAERLEQEKLEQEAAETALLEEQEEQLKGVGGRLDELNTILSSTQQKLKSFKQSACGSISTMFGRGSIDLQDGPSTSSSASSSRRNTTATASLETNTKKDDLIEALDNLDEMQENNNSGVQPVIPTEKIRAAKLDIQKKMSSHLEKLDSLIGQAEIAEVSMSEQTKQMRKMAKQ